MRRAQSDAGIRLEVQQAAVDLNLGGALPDRRDRRAERLVVEDAAVDEPRPGGRELRQLVEPEEPLLEPLEVDGPIAPEPALQRSEADRREDARDAGGGAGGEGEGAVGVDVEVVAAVLAAEPEREQVSVPGVEDRVRVGVGDLAAVAVEVGRGHEQLELVPLRHQRDERLRRRALLVHLVEGVVDPARHQVAAERRVLQRPQGDPGALQRARRQPAGRGEEPVDVTALEPEVAEAVEREVVRQPLREADAVDPARRGARDHVHDDARPELLGVPLGEVAQEPGIEALARRPAVLAGPGLQQCRALDEPVELLRDPVHVDRERGASVTDERKA